MKVTVELFGTIRYLDSRFSHTGALEVSLAANATVMDALMMLGLGAAPVQLALVTVNDRRATLYTPLRDGDTVRLISSVSGG